MVGKIKDLSKYGTDDLEKIELIANVLRDFDQVDILKEDSIEFNHIQNKLCAPEIDLKLTKYCPSCGRKYSDGENVCFDCLVRLKSISDKVDIADVDFNPRFTFDGDASYDSFEKLLNNDNLEKFNDFNFSYEDYSDILHNIKSQAFKNFDTLIKSNEIYFDELDIDEKILIFAKSFVKVEYKSSGAQLGYFEGNTIYIDDRQTKSLQITTLIHELSHFLIKEILSHVLCRILNAAKNSLIDDLIVFILSYTPFTQLIDEYAAHNVEGRFTLFGFQDYSSYLQIERSLDSKMSRDEIEITKSIGNTFSLSVKDILESLIDDSLREDIKNQFLNDRLDKPDYKALEMENCQILNDEGFIKALQLILTDGCVVANANIDKL